MRRKLRMGMIGGGRGNFIGTVHRMAANLDGMIELKAAALSSSPEKALLSGKDLLIPENRIYATYQEMFDKEKEIGIDEKLDFVTIVTPNYMHFEPAMMALESGMNVVIDKPMTLTVDQARTLKKKAEANGLLICVTYVYSNYPLIKEAREIIQNGKIGKVRKVIVEYLQGWLSEPIEMKGDQRASWRNDPEKTGKAGCVGDIGTHAVHLAEYTSGLKIKKLSATLNRLVPGRRLDDDGNVLIEFENGASGALLVSQIAAGEGNNLRLRIYGEKGGIEWSQINPNELIIKNLSGTVEIRRAGINYPLENLTIKNMRTTSEHPEGYLEAFANLYRNFSRTLLRRMGETDYSTDDHDFPDAEDGLRGMVFIETAVESSKNDSKWTDFRI